MLGSKTSRWVIVSFLRDAATMGSASAGEAVHAHMMKVGLLHEITSSNHLLNMYARCGRTDDARKVFVEMPERNIVSWSAMIAGHARCGEPCSALNWGKEMHVAGVTPTQFALASLGQACSDLRDVARGKQIHAQAIISGFYLDNFVKTALVNMYSKCKDIDNTLSIFESFEIRDLVLYNAMIAGFLSCGLKVEAIHLLKEVKFLNLEPNESTFVSVIGACSTEIGIRVGEQIHACTVRCGLDTNDYVGTALVDMYSRYSDMESALMVFNGVILKDAALWNAMIVRCIENDIPENALGFFIEMKSSGCFPDQSTFGSVLRACGTLNLLRHGKIVHTLVKKSEFCMDVIANTALIDMYMKCGATELSLKVFNEIGERKNTISFNSMIHGYAQNGKFEEAMGIFSVMRHQGREFDQGSFVAALGACNGRAYLMHTRVIYSQVIKLGYEGDLVVQNALLNALVKGVEIDEAHMVFEGIPEKNLVSWTTMVAGFSQLGLGMEALGLFRSMQIAGLHPNNFTCTSILRACASISALEQGQSIHGYMIKHGIEEEDFIYNALVDMYAKCGALNDSYKLFNNMLKPDIATWNSIVCGCAHNGYAKEALELLEKMHQSGTKLNNITFICILSACSHSGFIDQGVNIFESMASKFGVLPSMDHYACMVDMFGRAGMLDRAKDLIDGMPFEANAFIWKTFLSCCKLHGHLEFAERAREHILRLEPEDSSMFVAMSNLYSGVGEWQNVQKLRNKMKERRMKKEPGMSWLETKHGG
ncbi:pentatricopeptide repeat-containing protein At4g13650-like [Nymphaea colorata]|nr:pentatricopeptide repeat-containing protein At4g13650-like [Nymphaea colorata]